MDNINKKIMYLSFEIVFAILIIVFNFIVFYKGDTPSQVFAYSNKINALELKEVTPLELTNIVPVTNDIALKEYNKSHYQIYNPNNSKMNYRLIYRMYNSTVKPEWFNYYLKMDDKEYISNLGNLGPKNSEDYIDLILKEGTINKNKTIDFEYLIWLDYNVNNEAQNKSFSSKLIVETY